MRAFIIRPFGTKQGIDFDAVERLLIEPALQILGISGRTTLDILRQGNIRLDMFQRLLTADLVVADVSIYNANVFYELGIRHALRDKRTFLIRCDRTDVPPDEVPFDLKTDRYFSYPKDDPASRLNDFVKGLEQEIRSEASDSPVFMLLPELQAQPTSRFLPVPRDFREEVERSAADKRVGDLGLLADEVKGLEWEIEGLRVVGRAQFTLKAFDNARDTWETIHGLDSGDEEANELLATIYQRLGELVRSDQTLQRVLERKNIATDKRAELQALVARNAKTRWIMTWERIPIEQRRIRALSSPFLRQSFDAYERAFYSDLNHFYAGLNALAMLTIIVELAQSQPAVWATRFDSDAAGTAELEDLKKRQSRLADAMKVAVEAALGRLKAAGERDVWAELSDAETRLLTSKRPPRVATAYQDALAGASDQQIDSARNQVLLYQQLGIAPDNVSAALAVIPSVEPAPSRDACCSSPATCSTDPHARRHVSQATRWTTRGARSRPRFSGNGRPAKSPAASPAAPAAATFSSIRLARSWALPRRSFSPCRAINTSSHRSHPRGATGSRNSTGCATFDRYASSPNRRTCRAGCRTSRTTRSGSGTTSGCSSTRSRREAPTSRSSRYGTERRAMGPAVPPTW